LGVNTKICFVAEKRHGAIQKLFKKSKEKKEES
jgi:hypothetical protein